MEEITKIAQVLRRTREELGLSISEVSQKTKIHENVLRKLEEATIEKEISKIYVKSFVKKYASFLGIDPDELTQDYIKTKEVDSLQQIRIDEPAEEKDISEQIKKFSPIVILILGVGIAGFIIIFSAVKVVSFVGNIPNHFKKTQQQKIVPEKEVVKTKPKKKPAKKKAAASVKKNTKSLKNELTLKLKTDSLVWMKVQADGEVVFQGNLSPNDVESWKAQKSIKLRVGNLRALDFTVNSVHYGNIGFGVKDIFIDKKGLKINGEKYTPSLN